MRLSSPFPLLRGRRCVVVVSNVRCVSCEAEIPPGSEFCNRCGAEQVAEETELENLDVSLYNIVMTGLVGTGVALMFWTILSWVAGWTSDPRFRGFEWFDWMTIFMLGLGLVSIIVGISASLARLYGAGRIREWLFWSFASPITLGLTFAAAMWSGMD
jgi:ribosomal protein L40E